MTFCFNRSVFLTQLALFVAIGQADDSQVDFTRQIRPILTNKCFRCHGPDEGTRESGLRLDVREQALAAGESGLPGIVPGKPEESEVVARIFASSQYERMPPPESGITLDADQQQLLRRWIEQGASYEQHWAYVAPAQTPLPTEFAQKDWVRNGIDAFVLRRLERAGLQPSPAADRYAIIRRVTLDLTGLPPSLQDVERFVHDTSSDAYERLVDRLLALPAFGERWARVWLDLARYADSAGYAQDPARTIWRYRDWVIQALNDDMPFDQFTIEQIAGDLLPNPTAEQLLATAFHRNTMTNSEGGTDDEEFRNAAVVDRVNTTMQVWMGLTMGCAQCHTHKYDPITHEEYFRVFAIFNNTQDADRGDESPTLPTFGLRQRIERERLLRQTTDEQNAELKKQLEAITPAPTPIMRELAPGKRRRTHIQVRGNFLVRGDEVSPGVPALFDPLPDDTEANRAALANWLVDAKNPLTARVAVNRIWEQLFGAGIVVTSEDFGVQGQPPTHPQLLDYLATEFRNHGWDTKRLIRTIVTSATYRQSSRVSPELLRRDPDNQLLARGPRFRLSAEMIRDQALEIAGLLSHKMYGESVRPPQPAFGQRAAFGGSTDWQPSPGEDCYRRGLYTSWRRTTPYPSMMTFDATSREVCTIRRVNTNTPLQALVTLNDPVYVEAARALAQRMMRGGQTDDQRATFGFRLCLSRPPSDAELNRIVLLYERARQRFEAAPGQAKLLATGGDADLDVTELAAWTVVGNVLLNLDELLAKR